MAFRQKEEKLSERTPGTWKGADAPEQVAHTESGRRTRPL